MNKKGFTLVELIVVITILAILGTIAFISFQGYSRSSRDSARISDIENIQKSLDLYFVNTSNYPSPDYGTVVYYKTGSNEVWTQGTIGIETVKRLDRLDKVTRDPLSGNEYTYSRLNTKKEYQVAAALEGGAVSSINLDNNKRPVSIETGLGKLIPQANASSSIPGTAYVKGNYNGQIAKVQSGAKTYVLAVPTIINGDMTLTDIIDILNDKRLVYDGYSNLPDSYKNTNFVIDGGFDYSQTGGIVVFSGSINDLKKDENDRVLMIKNMQDYYKDTIIKDNDNIKNIVDLNIDLLNPSEGLKDLAKETVENNLNESVKEDYGLVDIGEELGGGQEPMIEPILTIWGDSTNTSMNYLLAERPASQFRFVAGNGGNPAACTSTGADCIVEDTITGLMWESVPSTTIMNWEVAKTYCVNLSLGGYEDWRLPDITELNSIVDYSRTDGSNYWYNTYFTLVSRYYWSSTTDAANTNYARGLNLYYAGTSNGYKDGNGYVLCAR